VYVCKGTDALQACLCGYGGVADAWREYDFNQQQETYVRGRSDLLS